jgi:peptidoglycan/LPS O-acetylase OafA/YrhL
MTSANTHLSHPRYRPDIDGLRAVAVLSVVAYHAFPSAIPGGFIGVDVFFVISGFLISTIIFENLERGTFSFTEFYARRVRRIFPALLVVLTASWAFGWLALMADEYQQLGKHVAAGAGFVSNLALWGEAGYFDKSADVKPLLHLWSLGIEEQFYIVWPLLLWATYKRSVNLAVTTLVIVAVSFSINLAEVDSNRVAAFYSPLSRFWELMAGGLLAWLSLHHQGRFISFAHQAPTVFASTVSFIGFGLLLLAFWSINENDSFPGTWALLPILGTLGMILAGPSAWLNRALLSRRTVVWLGLVSYPLYLWHWPMISFTRIIEEGTPPIAHRVVAVVLSILLAWLTYRLVERPLRFGKHERTKTLVLVISMFIIGGLGLATYIGGGFSSRLDKLNAVQDIVSNPLPPVAEIECGKNAPELQDFRGAGIACTTSQDFAPTIAFVGDSHTLHYKNAVWNQLGDASVLMVVMVRCLPFATDSLMFANDGDCSQRYETITRYLEHTPSVRDVVISAYWAYLASGKVSKYVDNWNTPGPLTEEAADSFRNHAVDFLSRMQNTGKRVIFMRDIPNLDFNIRRCFDTRPLRITPPSDLEEDCSMSQRAYEQRAARYDVVIEDILRQFPSVTVYDPRPLFCSDGRCRAADDALPLYMNGDHLNHHGASIVIRDFKQAIGLGSTR